jgi:hypothetical protein
VLARGRPPFDAALVSPAAHQYAIMLMHVVWLPSSSVKTKVRAKLRGLPIASQLALSGLLIRQHHRCSGGHFAVMEFLLEVWPAWIMRGLCHTGKR